MLARLEYDGYCLVPGAFSAAECDHWLAEWSAVAARGDPSVLRTQAGQVFGARDLLQLWPHLVGLALQSPVAELVRNVLGPGCGLVRALFFDKPPGASWALPWHKDVTVAVRDNSLPSDQFCHPTRKNGVPHVEAPVWLLERMLSVRVHLDEVTPENGPLRVLPGSHRAGKELGDAGTPPGTVVCGRGDVLLMRPLLAHASGHSAAETTRHRRVVHLEFAGPSELPDGFRWHDFVGL